MKARKGDELPRCTDFTIYVLNTCVSFIGIFLYERLVYRINCAVL